MSKVKLGILGLYGGTAYTFLLFLALFFIILFYSLNKELKQTGQSLYQVLISDNLKLMLVAGTVIFIMATALKSRTADVPSVLLFSGIAGGLVFLAVYADQLDKVLSNVQLDLNPFDDLTPDRERDRDLKLKIQEYVYNRYADPAKDEVYYVGSSTLNMYADAAGVDRCKRFLGQCYETYDYVGFVETDSIIKITESMPAPADIWNEIIVGKNYPLKAVVNGKTYIAWYNINVVRTDLNALTWAKQQIYGSPINPDFDYPHLPREDARKLKSFLT